MGSIFNTLTIGYSGLNAAQIGVDTTSHNITNAESEGYTRQRVVTAAAAPILSTPGSVGNGTTIVDIERIFDNFVYERYTGLASDKEFSDFTKSTLKELSTYFPEIENVGIKADLQEYYSMWQSFADNPDSDAIKIALAKQTETLSKTISEVHNKVTALQSSLNEQLGANVDEVNLLAKELAQVNISIDTAEAGGAYSANDLRDKRNSIELRLAKLIGADPIVGQIQSTTSSYNSVNETLGSYTLSVNGFNIVDGGNYHPIHIARNDSQNSFFELSYQRQDGVLIPMQEAITGGRIGAILNLRGDVALNSSDDSSSGVLQKVIEQLDAFASGLIESTNNIYASNSTTKMESNNIKIDKEEPILNSSLNVKSGSFDIVIYDVEGNISARRTINIDYNTTMSGTSGSNSIQGQIEAQSDDNDDGNANNDVDDYLNYNWASYLDGSNGIELSMDPSLSAKGFTFSIEDNLKNSSFNSGSNFAGALGLNKFFDGEGAKNINLNHKLIENPTNIRGGKSYTAGDNTIALNMVQQQFEVYDFSVGRETYNSTIYGMFDVVATHVGVTTNEAILKNDSVTAQFNATELEYSSVSKVSIDEELTNLIKYQTSYGAASKIITTVDQMMQTLLGLKQ